MRSKLKITAVAVGMGACLLFMGNGRAYADGSIEIFIPPTVTPTVGGFLWTYTPEVSPNSDVNPTGAPPTVPETTATLVGGSTTSSLAFADYFTIFDFEGYTGVHYEPAGWGFFTQLVGPNAADQNPADDPGIINLVWYRTGATVPGPAPLGDFSAVSIYDQRRDDNYVGSDTRRSDNATQGNISTTQVPLAVGIIPEPGTMALVGSGLLSMVACGGLRRKRIQ